MFQILGMTVEQIHYECHAAGMIAGIKSTPTPMGVCDSNGTLIEVVNDGVCGFAWVNFPGNTAFGRAMKKAGLARASYPTGLCVWVGEFNQSMTRKEAYARSYASHLRTKFNIANAYPGSRMD